MSDSDEGWHEIDAIFSEALERSPGERAAFLRNRCAGRAELQAAVQELLDAADAADAYLERTIDPLAGPLWSEIAAELDRRAPDSAEGRRIGPYRLLRELGRGGMATVFLAERADGEFEQQVALKLIRRGLDTEDVIQRFLAERQILSSLNHPNIAWLLDGGSTDDGLPYLVMEHVEGEPITAYADGHRLTVRERLRLFLDIGEAVQFAHGRLVVHRDLKPSNVLVDAEGRVKLLDFGIAKLLDAEADPATAARTRTGLRLLTPEWASPEQVRGDPVTVSSDIYQLGMLLYVLLTGRRPYDVSGRSASALERAITETSATPPSRVVSRGPSVGASEPPDRTTGLDAEATVAIADARRTTPEKLRRRLAGDLDTVILKALRKDPVRRYASVEQLLADVRSYLSDRPISARPDSWRYRTRKFLRRRPWVAPTSAAIALLLAGYLITVLRYSGQMERQRDIARDEAAKALEVQQFLVDLFRSPDPYAPADTSRGRDITVREALWIGTDRVRQELAERPAVQAALLGTVSDVYDNLDLNPEARRLREETLEIERSLYGDRSPEVAASLRKLGRLTSRAREDDSALAILENQLELALEVHGPEHPAVALSYLELGHVLQALGSFEEAVTALEEATRIQRSLTPADTVDLVATLGALGSVYPDVGRPEDALRIAEEVLAMCRSAFGEGDLETALARLRLASALDEVGRAEEAVVQIEQAMPILESRLGESHEITLTGLNNLAVSYGRLGDFVAAERSHREVLERRLEKYGPNQRLVAESMQNLAAVLGRQGKYAEAAQLHLEAYESFTAVLPPGHYLTAFPLLSLSGIRLSLEDFRGAEEAAGRALAILGEALPPGHAATAMTECRLGRALAGLGRISAAAELLRSALDDIGEGASLPSEYVEECRSALAALD